MMNKTNCTVKNPFSLKKISSDYLQLTDCNICKLSIVLLGMCQNNSKMYTCAQFLCSLGSMWSVFSMFFTFKECRCMYVKIIDT